MLFFQDNTGMVLNNRKQMLFIELRPLHLLITDGIIPMWKLHCYMLQVTLHVTLLHCYKLHVEVTVFYQVSKTHKNHPIRIGGSFTNSNLIVSLRTFQAKE